MTESAAALENETLTFLFSDIEGSTSRWERDRGAMAQAVARHDAIMRAAINAAGGQVFKTVGDAFCAVFESAHKATAASIEAQRQLVAEDFSALDGLQVPTGGLERRAATTAPSRSRTLQGCFAGRETREAPKVIEDPGERSGTAEHKRVPRVYFVDTNDVP